MISLFHLFLSSCGVKRQAIRLVVVLLVEDTQDGEEQVQNIQIEGDRSSDFFFDMIMTHDQLSVDQDISREDQSTKGAVDKLGSAAHGEESSHESKQNEEPQSSK